MVIVTVRYICPKLSCHTIEPLFIRTKQRNKEQEGERDKERERERERERVINNELRGMKEHE